MHLHRLVIAEGNTDSGSTSRIATTEPATTTIHAVPANAGMPNGRAPSVVLEMLPDGSWTVTQTGDGGAPRRVAAGVLVVD